MKKTTLSSFTAFLLALQPISVALAATVVPGDTLSGIAESHYQNWIKWKDIWKINQDRVKNPNLIYPGQKLRMLNGEEFEVGAVSSGSRARGGRSGAQSENEWKLLPKQSWERFVFKLSPEIDPSGFDRRSRSNVRVNNHTIPSEIISADRLAIHGEIVNARSEYSRLFLGEQVFIKADEELQVGTTYAVTSGPEKISSKRDGRVGFGYDIAGRVKIVGVRDGLFIGTITHMQKPIMRHQLLIPNVQFFSYPRPQVAPSAIVGNVIMPQAESTEALVQERMVFLDVGAEEGIKPGMIFRSYVHTDPLTHEEISSRDFLIQSEMQVVNVLDKFSSAVILQGSAPIQADTEVVALTDLTDFGKSRGMQGVIQDPNATPTVDELDQIDDTQGLGSQEDKDLRQLEKWSKPSFGNGSSSEDIQRVEPHPESAPSAIGDEVAPNDGSNLRAVPQTVPDTSVPSTPAPETGTSIQEPSSGAASGAAVGAGTGTVADQPIQLESTSTAPTQPAPVTEKSTLQSAETTAGQAERATPPVNQSPLPQQAGAPVIQANDPLLDNNTANGKPAPNLSTSGANNGVIVAPNAADINGAVLLATPTPVPAATAIPAATPVPTSAPATAFPDAATPTPVPVPATSRPIMNGLSMPAAPTTP